MPLKALLDNEPIIAPLLDDAAWAALRDRRTDLILPCCPGVPVRLRGGAGTQRIQHFYHSPLPTCSYTGETVSHLTAKAQIARACHAAGWTVDIEHAEDDWRADVLVEKGKHRIAFEVQWSRQTLEETERRQSRYVAAGVRCCWLFRYPPKELKRWQGEGFLDARKDLPLFALGKGEERDTSIVLLNGRRYSVSEFVTRLLARRIAFRSQVSLHGEQTFRVNFYAVRCWNQRCRRYSHAYCLDHDDAVASCSLPVWIGHGETMWGDDKLIFRPEIVSAVRHLCRSMRTRRGSSLRVGAIKRRYSRTAGGAYLSFGCHACDVLLGDFFLREERERAQFDDDWDAQETITVQLIQPVSSPQQHWCDPSDGDFCASGDVVQTRARP